MQNTSDPFVIDGQTLTIIAGNGNNVTAIDFATDTNFTINYDGYVGSFSTTVCHANYRHRL